MERHREQEVFGQPYATGRWLFVVLGISLLMCMGTVYSWSVFRKPLEQELGIGATQSSLPYMVFLASFSLLVPVAGVLIGRIGPRRLLVTGGLLLGVGWLASGFAPNIGWLTLTFGVIAGAGVGIAYGAPIATVTRWFPDRRGLAVGLVLLGFGLSPVVSAPVARLLIDLWGPFGAFKALGVSFALLIGLMAIPFRFPSPAVIALLTPTNLNPAVVAPEVASAAEVVGWDLLKIPRFYALWWAFATGTLAGLAAIGMTSPVGEEMAQLDPHVLAALMPLFAICNGVGRPLFGWLADRWGPAGAAFTASGLIVTASALAMLIGPGTIVIFTVTFSLLWLTLGGWMAVAPAATAAYFGLDNHSRNYGLVFTAYGFGAILGSLASGVLRDMLGSYRYAFYPIAAAGVVSILLAACVRTRNC